MSVQIGELHSSVDVEGTSATSPTGEAGATAGQSTPNERDYLEAQRRTLRDVWRTYAWGYAD